MNHTVIDRPHTVSSYDDQLSEVWSLINRMADLAQTSLAGALDALQGGDKVAAMEIVTQDKAIDDLELSLERLALLIITSRAPMADDLRYLIVAIRIGKMLERTGDQAKRIARRVDGLGQTGLSAGGPMVGAMGRYANSMVADAIRSFNGPCQSTAKNVERMDKELNSMNRRLSEFCCESMRDGTLDIGRGVEIISIAKQLERVGDYAANIAADVSYMITGEPKNGSRGTPDQVRLTA